MKKLILIVIAFAALFVGYKFYTAPTMIVPYPYIIKKIKWPGQKEAQQAQVVIVGDRMGKKLDSYLEFIEKSTSKNLREPLKIFNWSRDGEGLHRTFAKIKSLKKLPPLIIYHGASQELYEKKFSLRDRNKILANIHKYNNDSLISLILTFPTLSKFIYKKVGYRVLDKEIKITNKEYSSAKEQMMMELSYMLYEIELKELIQYIRSKGSKLILLTTPINLDAKPQVVCDNTTTPTLEEKISSIQDLIKAGDYKTASNQLKQLSLVAVANTSIYFQYGQVLKALGRYQQARKILQRSAVYDCRPWRGNIVYNNIIRSLAKKNNLEIIDFDEMINRLYGQNVLFFDDIYPQNIFYQQITKIITSSIIKILHI